MMTLEHAMSIAIIGGLVGGCVVALLVILGLILFDSARRQSP